MTKINCDMGESFGIYNAGNDEEITPLIDVANVACGFHASDPNHMRKTVELAKKNKVKVGAHPSFPDLQGFGRREMKMPKLDLKNMIMYQVGALKAFLDEHNMPLNHIKPHGSLYVMASKDEEIARAIADAVETFPITNNAKALTIDADDVTGAGGAKGSQYTFTYISANLVHVEAHGKITTGTVAPDAGASVTAGI